MSKTISDRYWRLDLLDSTSLHDAAPSLRVGWVPQKVIFIAQGKGPYLLAYGNGDVSMPRFDMESLFRDNAGLERGVARLGSRKELGGAGKLIPSPPPPPSAKEIWGKRAALAGMVVATLLLGWMVYLLAKKKV